jgi:hypothetical protein
MYRLAKKYWFHDFDAYRNVAHDAEAKARDLAGKLTTPAKTAANKPQPAPVATK